MYARDWSAFLKKGTGKEIAVAQLSAALTTHLGAKSDRVYFHYDYVKKAVDKHHVPPEQFEHLFDAIEFGAALDDRPLHITFLYYAPKYGWLQVTVKRAFTKRLVYIATFYKTNAREVRRKMRKFKVLRK